MVAPPKIAAVLPSVVSISQKSPMAGASQAVITAYYVDPKTKKIVTAYVQKTPVGSSGFIATNMRTNGFPKGVKIEIVTQFKNKAGKVLTQSQITAVKKK